MANIPVDVQEGIVHTSPGSRLGRIAFRNLTHMARNRAVWTVTVLGSLLWASAALLGSRWTLGITLGLAALLGLYRLRWPVSFRRHITLKIWSSLLSVFKYRRRWRNVLRKSDVIAWRGEDPPRIIRVTATKGTRSHPGSVHTVRIRMNDGHTVHGNYTEHMRAITQSFNAVAGSVNQIPDKNRQLDLQFIAKDPLINDVQPYPTTTDQLFTGYPLAKQDNLQPWHLKLVGTHIAVGGETGSGKGSVFQTVLKAIQPARRDGIAKVFGLDNKGGVELGLGGELISDRFISPHFDGFAYRSVRDSLRLLDMAWKEVQRRQQVMLGKSRLWEPGPDGDEYMLFLVDEIGVFKWQTDRKLAVLASNRLSLLITQARAFGITIMYAGQDLRKDIVAFRGQTPTRISLRTAEPEDIDMLLGNGAWRRGARSDEIPDTMPGTAYVATEAKKGFQRIRFANITDDMITGKDPVYAEDVAEARVLAEAAAARQQNMGIERYGGFA